MHLAIAAYVGCLLTAADPNASPVLDITARLERPGIKMVAVELYATWCKPCMDAIPRWRALRDRYRKQGLEVLIVTTHDRDGKCETPGWTADEVFCDHDGTLAEELGVRALPAAFLWSWRGELLVRAGRVDDVAVEVDRWMKTSTRVRIEASREDLAALLANRIAASGKLDVTPTDAERSKLDEIKAISYQPRYDDAYHCDLGRALPANSLLRAWIRESSLHLRLISASDECVVAESSARFDPRRAGASVATAVRSLLGELRAPAEFPGQSNSVSPNQVQEGEVIIANFTSAPGGAAVFVDRKLICTGTPCAAPVAPGVHKVRFESAEYDPEERWVTFTADDLGAFVSLHAKSNAILGELVVVAKSSDRAVDVLVKVDGTQEAMSGDRISLPPGIHRILIEDSRYVAWQDSVEITQGMRTQLLAPLQQAEKRRR